MTAPSSSDKDEREKMIGHATLLANKTLLAKREIEWRAQALAKYFLSMTAPLPELQALDRIEARNKAQEWGDGIPQRVDETHAAVSTRGTWEDFQRCLEEAALEGWAPAHRTKIAFNKFIALSAIGIRS